jgi:c(7)-type cytochrome triheme protein
MKRLLILSLYVMCTLVFAAFVHAETQGNKKKRAKPYEYGNVVLYNKVKARGEAPVVFKHWLHRAMYTCRLCHVDIGFAMTAGRTGVSCEDNKEGLYCGSCHNGKESFARKGSTIIGNKKVRNCDRCHSLGKDVPVKHEFRIFKMKFKPERFGNGLDWMRAEKYGRIKLKDELPGITIKREKLKDPEDSLMIPNNFEDSLMPGIIFSHGKHAVWSGCELCHPEIFEVNKTTDEFGMQDIFNGKYCGACHDKVAFPNIDCRRCHSKVVF